MSKKDDNKRGAKEQPEVWTAPFDPRFPNMNQTQYCYQSYLEYHRCLNKRGKDREPCNYFNRVCHSMCPNAWIAKWDEQRETGSFPVKLDEGRVEKKK